MVEFTSLSYLALYAPSLGPTEETVARQLLFYTTQPATPTDSVDQHTVGVASPLDTQLRNVGLVQGIIELGSSFSRSTSLLTPNARNQGVTMIDSASTRSYISILEPGVFALLCLNRSPHTQLPHPEPVIADLQAAHAEFTLLNGSLSSLIPGLVGTVGERVGGKIDRFWMRYAHTWSASSVRLRSVDSGSLLASKAVRLSDKSAEIPQDLVAGEEIKHMIVTDTDNHVIYATYNTANPHILAHVARQAAKRQASNTLTTTETQAQQQPAQPPWYHPATWVERTGRVFSGTSASSTTTAVATASAAGESVKRVTGAVAWWDGERDVYVGEEGWSKLWVGESEHVRAIVVLPKPLSQPTIEEVEHLITQITRQIQHTPTTPVSPWYTLAYHHHRQVYSSSLPPYNNHNHNPTDSKHAATVAANTAHLHALIVDLIHGRKDRATERFEVVRSSRNAWVVVSIDLDLTIVLARPVNHSLQPEPSSGETLEGVTIEARKSVKKAKEELLKKMSSSLSRAEDTPKS
ncbi:hypothetical protein PYCC9005_004468 [Savitreella phatthalungensis]